jgi:dsRNA-specific ribonuclease
MVSLEEQEKVVFLNSQYNDNKELIDRLQIKLVENITKLDLSPQDLQDTQEYLQDKGTKTYSVHLVKNNNNINLL